MADERDFSSALDRVLQQQQQQGSSPAAASPNPPESALAPTTNLLTGAAPTPSPFADALDRVIRGDTASPDAQTVPEMSGTTPAPTTEPVPTEDIQVAQDAASGVATANGLLSEGVRPEVVAEVRKLARDEGIPLPLAAQTYIERSRAAPGTRYRRLLQQNPGLRRIATQGGAYADFMTDADELAITEQSFGEAKKEWSIAAIAGSVEELGNILEDTLVGRAITRGSLQTAAALPTTGAALELGIALDIGATEEQILERIAAPYGGWDAMENYPASMRMSVLSAARQQYNLVQGLSEDDRAAALQRAGEYYFSAGELVSQAEGLVRNPGSQSFITNTLSQAPNTIEGTLEAFASDPVNGGLFLAETILESVPSMVSTIVISRVTGSLSLGAAVGATTGGGREYVLSTTQFLAERGYTINSVEDAVAILQNAELMQEASDFGFARAIPIAIFDGLAGVASGVQLGRTALGDVTAQTTVQTASGGTGEALAQIASEGEITSLRDITIEALAELPTALVEVPFAAGRTFGSQRLPPELNQLLALGALQSAADQATAAQQSLETTRAAIDETATFARDPDAVRELLVASGDQEVSIPVQEIERLYQEGALTDDDIAYLNVEDELTQQGELSGDVVTTASRVLTLQGDAFARLSEHVRTQAGAPTAAEAREALANREADITRLQATLEQAQNVAGEINTLADTIADQIRSTTNLTRGQSRAAGRLMAERYAARAALFQPGTTAQSLYERDRVTFERDGGVPARQSPTPNLQLSPTIGKTYSLLTAGRYSNEPVRIDQVDEGEGGSVSGEIVSTGEKFEVPFSEIHDGLAEFRTNRGLLNTVPGQQRQPTTLTEMSDDVFGEISSLVIDAPRDENGDVRLQQLTPDEKLELRRAGIDVSDEGDIRYTDAEAILTERAQRFSGSRQEVPGALEQGPVPAADRLDTRAPVRSPRGSTYMGVGQQYTVENPNTDAPALQRNAPLIQASTNANNAEAQSEALDALFERHPDPLASEAAWVDLANDAFSLDRVPMPPFRTIEIVQQGPEIIANEIRQLSEGMRRDAEAGLQTAQEFGEVYASGAATPDITAKAFLWSFLSRGVSPYVQEAAFLDAIVSDRLTSIMQRATADGWSDALGAEYGEWAASAIPPGSPGRGTQHNLNAFGRNFMRVMTQRHDDAGGRTGLEIIHGMIADGTPSYLIRREFLKRGSGAGIDNKVVSFTLLLLGRSDVLVLDRVQVRNQWNDGRFDGQNIYDSDRDAEGKEVTGSVFAEMTFGHKGLLYYETMERALQPLIEQAYTSLGIEGSLGRYHWDSWLLASNQEVGHASVDGLLRDAQQREAPYVGAFVRQGKYAYYDYGFRYGVLPDGSLSSVVERLDGTGAVVVPYAVIADPKSPARKVIARLSTEAKKRGTEYGAVRPWTAALTAEERATYDAAIADAGSPAPDVWQYDPNAVGRATVAREQRGAGGYSSGGLAPLSGAPNVVGAAGPDAELVSVAEQYAAANGIDLRRQAEFVEVDPERATRIAQAYEEMAHAPQDPAVQAAYADLIQQTIAQYQALIDAGYSFTFFDGETDPYAGNPWNAMRDLRANKTMAVYGTYDGYGTEGLTAELIADNPMLQDTGLVWQDQNGIDRPVTANDLFRAVHDAFGHGIEGAGFRARGEENAWQAHVRLFTGPAIGVLTSETRGQNSWLNYGPYGEQNRTASVEDTVFAPQKAGIMPEFTWTEGRAGDAPIQEQTDGQPEQTQTTLYQRGISPDAADIRRGRSGEGAAAVADGAGSDAEGGATGQPVTGDDLGRIDDPEFLQEFLTRPGWGVVTASLALPDSEFYQNQRETNPDLYEMSVARQEARNAEENARLRRMLDQQGIPYIEVVGMYQGQPDGTSFMIVADEPTVMKFGRQFNQDSVLTRDGLIFTARPRADVPVTGEVIVGEQALQEDFYSVTPGGTQFSMELGFDAAGPGVAVIPEGYTETPDRPQLPVRPDGLVELHHWSNVELTEVDPAFAGTGPLTGVERRRGSRVTFFGINPRERLRSPGTGYVKEAGLGPVEHVGFVDPTDLYPIFEDPDGIAAGKNISEAEAAIREAGHLGYYTTDDGSERAPLGNVAVLFEAIPVQRIESQAQTLEQPTEGPQTPTQGAVGAPRGSYTLPTRDDPRNLIRLSTNADPSTFVHEVGHMFLFQMLRDASDPRITQEGKAQLEAQIEATRSWFSSNAEQGLSDLKSLAKDASKRAARLAAGPEKDAATLRATRLQGAVDRAKAGGGAEYMQRVAATFMDPEGQGYDEAAEVAYHELWARGFEKYLGTGSGPSADLRSAFAKFAQYISNVYKSLRRLNVTVSPEIADVFDRLLASEEAIVEERRGALYQLSPGVLESATPSEANELRRLASEAETQARTEMASRVENSLRAEARAKRRARREVLANEISEQVASEPIYAAINIAKRGTMPDGTKTGTGKIDRAEFVAVAGEDAVKSMPPGMVSGRTRPDNAIPLGDLATLSGFPDIYSMIEALTTPTPTPQATAVKERTDAAMQQEFGADLDAEALQNKAVEVAQNDKFAQLQRLQLRILRRLAAQPVARIAQRQAEQMGAPPADVDRAASTAAQAEQAAASTPREGVQAALARIRSDVQKTANASQRRAQVAARRSTAAIRLGLDPAAIDEAASRYVRTIKVKDATPARYRQAATRLTAKIERAIAERNYTEAATLMEQRALNLAVAKEAATIQTKIENQRTRWRGVTARTDKRLAQNYSIDWVNAIRVMLEPFGMARNTPRNYSPNEALSALQSVEPTLYTELQLAISTYGARAQTAAQANPRNPYKDLSVQEALDLLDTADSMLANARDSHGVLVEGRRVAFESIADEVAVNVSQRRKVQRTARKQDRGRGSRRFRETRRQLNAFKASLRRIEQWARDFDNGNPRGPLTRYLVRPVMQAIDAYTVARKGPQEALANLLRGRNDLMQVKPIRATELDGYVFRTKGELIMAFLHTGNPSNKRKLLLGGATDVETNRRYVWGTQDADGNLETARWDRFIERLFSEGTLTKADMDLVQGIWDIFEATKKAAQAAHKQMYGYYFTEVTAEPVVTPVGTYPGGYAPAITDSMMNPDGDRFEAEEVMSQQSNAAMFPGAEKGFTQSRTEYNQPLDLDLTRVPAHFDRVMKFAYLGPAVRNAARLVTNKAFREAVRPGSPDVIDVAVIPWLQRTVQQRVTTPPTNQGWSGVSRLAAAVDRRVGLHIMAGNLVNAAQQITGFPVAAARIPARHLAASATRWRVNTQSARAYILQQSPFMVERMTMGMNEASTTLEDLLREPGLLNNLQAASMRYGYFAQQLAQNLVDPTVWLAAERHGMEVVYPDAYAEALQRTGDEGAADAAARAEVVAYADSVVRDTQAPMQASDVSGIEASSPLARLFLKFYSYFNAMGNLLVTETNIAMNSDMGWAGRYGRSFYAYLMIVTIPSIVAESIAQLARGGLDDLEDEDERDQIMFELLIGSQLQTMAAMVPFAGQVASTAYGIAVTDQIYDDRISMSAGIGVTESTLQNTIRLIAAAADPDTDIETRRAIRTTLDTLGLISGLPTNWASKPISYAAGVIEGDSDPQGLGDIVQGILAGRDGTER